MALGIGVDVTWSGNHHRAILWNDRPASSSDIPVLVIDGQEYGTTDLMPDTRIMAKCLRPGLGPMWSIIQKAVAAGYPVEVEFVR